MLLQAGSGGGFFGDAPWWVFPLVVIPMMLVMMVGMGLVMWLMMRMMMGMGDHGTSHQAAASGVETKADETADPVVASLHRQVEDLQRRLAAMESGPPGQAASEGPPAPPT